MAKDWIKKFFIYLFLTIGAVVMMFPFYWMISSSVKTAAEYNSFPPVWIP